MSAMVRSLLLPPAVDERLTPQQWRTSQTVRLMIIATSIAIDVTLWLALKDSDTIDRAVLARFAVTNISVLAADAALTAASLRVRALQARWVLAVVTVLDMFTIAVWVQATGTMSSYFTLTGALLIMWYRLYLGYAVGLVAAASMFTFHFGAIALEAVGVLEPEPLFAGAPSLIYALPSYEGSAMVSMACIYFMMFLGGNLIFNKLKERDLAIAEIRREMQRVAEEVRHGRLTGTVLADQYALGELLGRGGMGEIYAARWLGRDRSVAIKVLHGHLVQDEQILERFRRESRVAERVPAEFRAQIYDVGADRPQDLHYIAMEHLRGEDLAAYLRRRGPLAPDELVPLARRIADAIDAAHAAGVVHRDLKPQNIFLVEESATGRTGEASDIRLLDFGMSKIVDHATQTLTRADAIIGTVAYMAPEQALGRTGDVGAASDRFSFAAVIYRALTGRLPFQAADLVAAIRLLATCHPPAPSSLIPDLHRDIDAVLVIGLAKKLELRYASARSLVDDLEAAARGELSADARARAAGMRSELAEGETLTAGTGP